jgi:HEAT repeat protein
MDELNKEMIIKLRKLLHNPLLTDPDATFKEDAIRYIHELTEETSERLVRLVLDVSSNEERGYLCLRLGILGSPRTVRPLVSHLLSDESERVRICSAWSLMQINDASALSGLAMSLNDTSKRVIGIAIEALANITLIKVIEPLISLLGHNDWDIRLQAVKNLMKLHIKDKRILPAIQGLATDPSAISYDMDVDLMNTSELEEEILGNYSKQNLMPTMSVLLQQAHDLLD